MVKIRPGEISCISGERQSGKTYSAMCAAKQFMDTNPCATVVWVDTYRQGLRWKFENMKFDLDRLTLIGCSDVQNFEHIRYMFVNTDLIIIDQIEQLADGRDKYTPRTIDFIGTYLRDIALTYNTAVIFTINKYRGSRSDTFDQRIMSITYSILIMLDNEYCIENHHDAADGALYNKEGDLCGYKMKVNRTKNRNGEEGTSEVWLDSNTGHTFIREELQFYPEELIA